MTIRDLLGILSKVENQDAEILIHAFGSVYEIEGSLLHRDYKMYAINAKFSPAIEGELIQIAEQKLDALVKKKARIEEDLEVVMPEMDSAPLAKKNPFAVKTPRPQTEWFAVSDIPWLEDAFLERKRESACALLGKILPPINTMLDRTALYTEEEDGVTTVKYHQAVIDYIRQNLFTCSLPPVAEKLRNGLKQFIKPGFWEDKLPPTKQEK